MQPRNFELTSRTRKACEVSTQTAGGPTGRQLFTFPEETVYFLYLNSRKGLGMLFKTNVGSTVTAKITEIGKNHLLKSNHGQEFEMLDEETVKCKLGVLFTIFPADKLDTCVTHGDIEIQIGPSMHPARALGPEDAML